MSAPGSLAPALPPLLRLRMLATTLMRGERPLFAFVQSLGAQALIVIINVVTGLIAARALGAQGRGVYAAVTVWPPLLAALGMAGLNDAILYRTRQAPAAMGVVAGAALWLGLGQSLIVMAAGALLLPLFLPQYPRSVVFFAQLCLLSVLVNSLQIVIKQSFAGAARYRQFNLMHGLPQLLHLLALLLVVSLTTLTPTTATRALLISGVAAVLCVLPAFVRATGPRLRGSLAEMRRLTWYSLRAAPMEVVFALGTYADRLVVIPMLPPAELGYYAVAFSLSRLVQFVQPAIGSVLFSHMTGQSAGDAKRLHDCGFRFLLVCLTAGCLLLWMVGKPLLVFAYGSDFAAASDSFRMLIIEASLSALSGVTVQLFLARGRPGAVSAIQVTVLVVSLLLLLVLVPRYGAVGAAAALAIAALLRCLLLLAALPGTLGLAPPWPILTRDDFRYLAQRLKWKDEAHG